MITLGLSYYKLCGESKNVFAYMFVAAYTLVQNNGERTCQR